jgi:hypothetical protein
LWFLQIPILFGGLARQDAGRPPPPAAPAESTTMARSRALDSSRFSWIAAAVRTVLSGSGELNVRVAGPAEQFALPTRLGLLDFDVAGAVALREAREVTAAAGVRLDKRLFRLPEIHRNACQVAQALAVDGLGLTPGGAGATSRVRVAVGRLERGPGGRQLPAPRDGEHGGGADQRGRDCKRRLPLHSVGRGAGSNCQVVVGAAPVLSIKRQRLQPATRLCRRSESKRPPPRITVNQPKPPNTAGSRPPFTALTGRARTLFAMAQ